MGDYTCENCIVKKRDECIGEEKICDSFKFAPDMTEADWEAFPLVMRSSRQSVHVEWKREQERNAAKTKPVNRNDIDKRDLKANDALLREKTLKAREESRAKRELEEKQKEERCRSLIAGKQDTYAGDILIFTAVESDPDTGGYTGSYVLEYKKTSVTGTTGLEETDTYALYNVLKEAFGRINDKSKNVVVFPALLDISPRYQDEPDIETLIGNVRKETGVIVVKESIMIDASMWYIREKHRETKKKKKQG